MKENLLLNRIKSFLYRFGISEQYIAFDYISYVLSCFISSQKDDFKTYKQSLTCLEKQYGICHRTICHSINTLLKKCKFPEPTKPPHTRALPQLRKLKYLFESSHV